VTYDNPFDPVMPGEKFCSCDVAAQLEADFNGRERPLCPRHDADAVAARKAGKERAELEDTLALGYSEMRRMREDQADHRAEKAQAEREAAEQAALEQLDPLTRRLTLISGASALPEPVDPRHQVGIGDDAAFTRMLAEMVGGTTNPDNDEGPTAA